MRAENEYQRHGTLAHLAAYDVHHARVIGRCDSTTSIAPFMALAGQVMTSQPCASANRVFWAVDNGASHRDWAADKPFNWRFTRTDLNRLLSKLAAGRAWLASGDAHQAVTLLGQAVSAADTCALAPDSCGTSSGSQGALRCFPAASAGWSARRSGTGRQGLL